MTLNNHHLLSKTLIPSMILWERVVISSHVCVANIKRFATCGSVRTTNRSKLRARGNCWGHLCQFARMRFTHEWKISRAGLSRVVWFHWIRRRSHQRLVAKVQPIELGICCSLLSPSLLTIYCFHVSQRTLPLHSAAHCTIVFRMPVHCPMGYAQTEDRLQNESENDH